MCGRYTLHHSPAEIAQRFAANELLVDFPSRYNIAPTQPVAVVTQNAFGDGRRLLEGMRWGLVPVWAKDANGAAKMINARAETVAEKPSFRRLLSRRRCLVPSDGFYEWRTEGKNKQPVHIRFRDSRLFAFAGLWDEWQSPDGSPLRSCTIITGPPNNLLATVHHRMAVILSPEMEEVWLDPALPSEIAKGLLQVHPDHELEAFEVPKRMGNPTYDAPDCISALEAPPTPAEIETGREQMALL